MPAILTLRAWMILSFVWVGVAAFFCNRSWPRMPLDVSAVDPATVAAFNEAVTHHVGVYTVMALGGPVLSYLIGRLWCRASKSS